MSTKDAAEVPVVALLGCPRQRGPSAATDMCARSLEILNRKVMVATHPEHSEQETADIIHNIGIAARHVLIGLPLAEADLRRAAPVDAQKFDMKAEA